MSKKKFHSLTAEDQLDLMFGDDFNNKENDEKETINENDPLGILHGASPVNINEEEGENSFYNMHPENNPLIVDFTGRDTDGDNPIPIDDQSPIINNIKFEYIPEKELFGLSDGYVNYTFNMGKLREFDNDINEAEDVLLPLQEKVLYMIFRSLRPTAIMEKKEFEKRLGDKLCNIDKTVKLLHDNDNVFIYVMTDESYDALNDAVSDAISNKTVFDFFHHLDSVIKLPTFRFNTQSDADIGYFKFELDNQVDEVIEYILDTASDEKTILPENLYKEISEINRNNTSYTVLNGVIDKISNKGKNKAGN